MSIIQFHPGRVHLQASHHTRRAPRGRCGGTTLHKFHRWQICRSLDSDMALLALYTARMGWLKPHATKFRVWSVIAAPVAHERG
jgi:hypothetical protein